MIVTNYDIARLKAIARMLPRPEQEDAWDIDFGYYAILWDAYQQVVEVIKTTHHVLDQLVPGDEQIENAIWQCRAVLMIQPEEPEPSGRKKVFHAHIDLADLLTWSDDKFEEEVLPFFKYGDADTFTTVREARTFLVRQFARGVRTIPIGEDGCDSFDMRKGCLGHPIEDEHHGST